MKIKLIVAKCINNGIGFQNKIPWYHKEDLKLFKQLTTNNGNNAILMGRKTFESIPNSPLPNRQNIVISKTLEDSNKDISIFSTIQNGINYARVKKYEELWIIGGSSIYEYCMQESIADALYITEINKEYTCDTFFPKINEIYKLNSELSIDPETSIAIYKKNIVNIVVNLNEHKMAGYWG